MNELGKELAGIIKFFKWCVAGYLGLIAIGMVVTIAASWINYWTKPAPRIQSVSAQVDDRGIVDYGER